MGAAVIPLASAALGAGASVYAARQQKKASQEASESALKAAREQADAQEKAAKIAAAANNSLAAKTEEIKLVANADLENAALRRRRMLGLNRQATQTGAMQTAEAAAEKTKLGA
jgi:uncharacterized protein HemX